MNFKMIPYISVYDLENALVEANLFDEDEDGELRNLLAGDCYANDSSIKVYLEGDRLYDETDEDLLEWYTIEEVRKMNIETTRVNAMLDYIKTFIPKDCSYILVDISW